MLRLISRITFNDAEVLAPIEFVNNIEIESSWKTFTDTATIKLPFKLKRDGKNITVGADTSVFKRGDKVKIEIGYAPNLITEFEGYISNIKPDSPLIISCQDESWLLKQKTITASLPAGTLQTLLNEVIEDVEVNAVGANLGVFRITRVNAVQILEELKKTYGLVSFVKDKILRVGLAYYPDESAEHEILFQRNVINSNLEYVNRDDVKIKVKAISILPDNTKIEAEAGDSGGTTRTFYTYNVESTEDLQKFANNELSKLSFDGYRGGFETFGEPSIKQGDLVTLKDEKFPEREGRYLVDSVVKNFGMNGYRQGVNLGPKN